MAKSSKPKTDRPNSIAKGNADKPRARARGQSTPFLSIDEAALYLRVTARALEHFRGEGGGPDYRKHGGSIVYHKLDLDRWSAMRRFKSTAEKADE